MQKTLKKLLLLSCLIAAALAGSYLSTSPERAPAPDYAAVPDVTFQWRGESKKLSDYTQQKKTVIVHFWASWCPPCVVEFPHLIKLARQYPQRLTLLAFSLDRDEASMEKFLEQYGSLPANFIPVWDEQGKVAKTQFYSFTYPESYIVNCRGEIAEKVVGVEENWPDRVSPHLANCTQK